MAFVRYVEGKTSLDNGEKGICMKFEIVGDEIKIYDFNALQAYKIGRHLETEGIEFYKNLLTHGDITSSAVKDGIKMLIDEEVKHLNVLDEKIDEISALEDDGFEEEDFEDIINTEIFSNFKDIKNKKDIFDDVQKTVEFGMFIEKRSIMFYEALLKHTENQSGRDAINKMISQERDHLNRLDMIPR